MRAVPMTLFLALFTACGDEPRTPGGNSGRDASAGSDRTITQDAATSDGAANQDAGANDAVSNDAATNDASINDAGAEDAGAPSDKRVFITAATFRGNFTTIKPAADGAASADALCSDAASGAGLGGTWRAWVSIATADAIDRISGTGPWRDLSGDIIFQDRTDLSTTPQTGLWRDERNRFLASDRIWTGTNFGGREDTLNGHCLDWTSGAMSELGRIGQVGRGDDAWTGFSSTSCDQSAHLICFEQ